ncbi:phosphoglycerate mutase family protein [Aspergillus sclerotioniger CBS 115572]|uniref:Phosphoglycerate mutase family protein n=1 Tax=Aspergillus sclerotioniger CBS 115572 TaxID=1450535 RepID=A0A317WQT5_9EURO|nr:phosphoglycerate mutase family protein [Aspergillus sclerotioniger CBS 115572]PWY88793.1 phosphoglycerate mutase family protein [Aspergillus sclerotioniger CBS 115572]
MPLDTIYLTRHGHRLNWTIDYKTGTYHSQFPTPTGNPADPTLTSHGVRQSHELAAHFTSDEISPKPFRIYSSPFYRCLQTIQPSVEALRKQQQQQVQEDSSQSLNNDPSTIDKHADLTVRIEPGLGEWFGPTTFFHHPSPAPLSTLQSHFPSILPSPSQSQSPSSAPQNQILRPSTSGETIPQLHDRLATTLSTLITTLDTEITQSEATLPPEQRTRKAVLICSHAAPLIAMGRVLTGNMPEDEGEEDFKVYTAGVSTFVRRGGLRGGDGEGERKGRDVEGVLAPGTEVLMNKDGGSVKVPDWREGRGVGGGWDCVRNGDCGFLSNGAERGWRFCGDESFDTGPMADPSATPTSSLDSSVETAGSKL